MVLAQPGYLEASSSGMGTEWRIGPHLSSSSSTHLFQTFLAQASGQTQEVRRRGHPGPVISPSKSPHSYLPVRTYLERELDRLTRQTSWEGVSDKTGPVEGGGRKAKALAAPFTLLPSRVQLAKAEEGEGLEGRKCRDSPSPVALSVKSLAKQHR